MKRKAILTIVLVIIAMAVMIRLGFWQLDRLAQRRTFNADVTAQLQASPLTVADLTGSTDLSGLNYRSIVLRGRYDYSQQVALNNQEWNAQPGVHLITPLVLDDSDQAVLVDRGWIPYSQSDSTKWSQFAESEIVEVRGRILQSQTSPLGAPAGVTHQTTWFRVDILALQKQISHRLVPIYVQQFPDSAWKNLPYRSDVNLDLTEGPHLGYALTWFSFTAILGIGSLGYVVSKRRLPIRPQSQSQAQIVQP
ncbi:MAG: SURF1 family protein [Chloroflexi bacterium]|nr:SURF1 family protein [Chloroflexota bacterium]